MKPSPTSRAALAIVLTTVWLTAACSDDDGGSSTELPQKGEIVAQSIP